jgi:superfamily II DNA or RNA helicase
VTLALALHTPELGPCAVTPREYQARAIRDLRAEIAKGSRYVLLVAPTGAGKTVCAGLVIRSAIEKGGEVLVLAHRSELLDQMYATCERVGIPRAWLQVIRGGDKRRNPGARVHIASVDTLRNWVGTGRLPKVRVIVIDEAHRSAAAGYVKIREAYPDAIVIGLTATPWRLDGKALDTLYTASVVVATIPELVQQGALVPVRCFTHPKGPDLSGVRTKGGDFDQEQAASVMRSRILLGSVVEEYKRRANGRAAFGFACNVAHAQELAEACNAAGIASVAIHGETPESERKAALEGLRSGRVQILWNASLFTEGTDVPQVKCVILARPTLSKALAFQMIGRGMRPCESTGFADCVLLDHAGVLPIHGHPMEPQDYALTSAKVKASGPAQTKNCPSCGETVAIGTTLCACGHTWERAEREGPTVVPGKLEEIKPKEPKVVPPLVERGMIRRAFAIAKKRGVEGDGARRYARGILRKQLHREPDAALFAEEASAFVVVAPAPVEMPAAEAANEIESREPAEIAVIMAESEPEMEVRF